MAELIARPKPEDKVNTIMNWFKDSYRAHQDWRAEGLSCYDFVNGGEGQWDSADLAKVKKKKRPYLTINKTQRQLLVLSGLQRSNRLDIKALPRGSNDVQSADLMSNLIEYTMNRSNADYEQTTAFEDGLITGLGALEVVKNFDDDLEGEYIIRSIDPLQVFFDPESRRADWDDARFVMKAPFKDVEELVHAFAMNGDPGLESKIRDMNKRMRNSDWLDAFGVDKTLTGNLREELGDAFWDEKTKKARVLECYYRTFKTIHVVEAPNGEIIPVEAGIGSEDLAKAAKRLAKAVGGEAGTRKVKVVRIATLLGWEILQDRESSFPTRRFPIIPYMPLFFRKHPYGLIRQMKDPQKEINKRRSQMLHILNTSSNGIWLNKAGDGVDPEVMQQKAGEPGAVLNYQETPPVLVPAAQIPTGLAQLDAMAEQDLQQIGAQAQLRGPGTQRFISGRAIQARQFGGQVQVTRFFDQLRLTRKILGDILVSIIPRTYSEKKIREIVDQEMARQPEGSMAGLVDRAIGSNEEAYEEGEDPVKELISRARKNRYDIVVEDAPSLPTQRQAAFQQMVQIGTMFPGVIDPDMLIEATDIKNKDEILARIESKMQQMGAQGLQMAAQTGRKSDSASERLDLGDAGQMAQDLTGGQVGPGEG